MARARRRPGAWYLGPDGDLTSEPTPTDAGDVLSRRPRSRAADVPRRTGANVWADDVQCDWTAARRHSASFIRAPLHDDTAMVGAGSPTCGSAEAADTDLEVTFSEIRPDGQEIYVQSGWLRASHRALDASARPSCDPSTPISRLMPSRCRRQSNQVHVELFPFTHVFRAGRACG